tara:strand:+ start:428 stop:592 length:165 start_codon:yes stop_codon:yes gene_type:complete
VIVTPVKDKSAKSTIATPDETEVLGFGFTKVPPPAVYCPEFGTSVLAPPPGLVA